LHSKAGSNGECYRPPPPRAVVPVGWVVATTTGDVEGREGGSLSGQWGWAVASALESPLVLPPALAVAAGVKGALVVE
jgi:hypothetical protein